MRRQDNEAIEMFVDYQRAKGLAATTIRNRRSILTTLAERAGDLVDCDIFTLRRHIGREGIKDGTRRTERGAILAFYSFLQEEGLRDDNPGLKLPLVRAPKGEPRPFTAEQIDLLLNSGAYRRTRAMILLGAYQGFRVSSIAAVHGHDIDVVSHRIHTVGKGKKACWLPMHPVIEELSATMPGDGWWFPKRHGQDGHISGAAVTNLIARAKKRAGIHDAHLTAHSLRHSFGTDLVEAEVDIRVVQELMMHSSLATTQIYTRVSERRKQEGIAALSGRDIPEHSGRTPRAA